MHRLPNLRTLELTPPGSQIEKPKRRLLYEWSVQYNSDDLKYQPIEKDHENL